MSEEEQVQWTLWNTVLPPKRQVDSVLWDAVFALLEEKIKLYFQSCVRFEASRNSLLENLTWKNVPPASLDRVLDSLVERQTLIAVEDLNLDKYVIAEDTLSSSSSWFSSVLVSSMELLQQGWQNIQQHWKQSVDEADRLWTHRAILENVSTSLWKYVREEWDTHSEGRFLIQELFPVFSGDKILCCRVLCLLVQEKRALVYKIADRTHGVKFGTNCDEQDINYFALLSQVDQLKQRVEDLHQRIEKVNQKLQSCTKRMVMWKQKKADHPRYNEERRLAAQLLRIRKHLDNSLEQIHQQLNKSQELLYSFEATATNRQAVDALKCGNKFLKSLQTEQVTIETVDDIMLDIQENLERQEEVNSILSRPLEVDSDVSFVLEQELSEMEENMTREVLKGSNDTQVENRTVSTPVLSSTVERNNTQQEHEPRRVAMHS